MIKKIFSVIHRELIKKMIYINTNLYMREYTKYLKKIGLKINGQPKFISNDVYFDGTNYSLITIEDNVTISREVMLLTHDYSITTAYTSIGKKIKRGEGEIFFLKGIKIGKNCFVGARSSILLGSEIGDNTIIGAGTVIKGKVPENSIVIGNPWRIIGKTDEYANRHEQLEDFLIER